MALVGTDNGVDDLPRAAMQAGLLLFCCCSLICIYFFIGECEKNIERGRGERQGEKEMKERNGGGKGKRKRRKRMRQTDGLPTKRNV